MRVFLLVWVILQSFELAWCENCVQAKDYVCNQIPTGYPPGVTSLVLFVSNMEEINSTVFNSTNLASVTSLTMTQCGITSIALKAFTHFQNLISLNLHNNALSQVTSAWFTHREVLESLTITNNSIVALNEDSFHGFSGLSSLNLSQNQIHTITSGCFSSLIRLGSLDLSNNKLSYLSIHTLSPLNNTKIHLHGNPWDCSCSVSKFALYLRALQKASLLQNEMEVLCNSPPHQRGIPVWKVSECLNPTTAVDALTTTARPLNPGGIKPSTLISLIVLYHRKRERKHLLTIQPSPLERESAKRSPANCRTLDESKSSRTTNPNNKILLKLDRSVLESEKASHIFQIYSKGLYPRRQVCPRTKSAGPEFFRSWGGMQMETCAHEDLTDPRMDMMEGEKLHSEISESEDKKGEPERCPENNDHDTDTSLTTGAILNLMMDADVKEDITIEENAVQNIYPEDASMSIGDEAEHLSFNAARTFQEENPGTIQLLDDGENMPYFTIGPDPEKQRSVQKPKLIYAEACAEKEKTRPIRRVQSWPPSAAQWKKHWSQNQQLLDVSPHLIFLTQYSYQVSMFPPTSPEMTPHEHQSHVQVRDLRSMEPSRESMIQSYIQGSSTSAEGYVSIINELSDLDGIPPPNYKSVTPYNPLDERTNLKRDDEDPVKIKTNGTRIKSRCDQTGSGSGRQPWRKDRKGKKAEKKKPRNPPRTPGDDSLLVGNEYTFIDLLHEVVENQGRWTRERWRQSHINKSKNKQFGKSQ